MKPSISDQKQLNYSNSGTQNPQTPKAVSALIWIHFSGNCLSPNRLSPNREITVIQCEITKLPLNLLSKIRSWRFINTFIVTVIQWVKFLWHSISNLDLNISLEDDILYGNSKRKEGHIMSKWIFFKWIFHSSTLQFILLQKVEWTIMDLAASSTIDWDCIKIYMNYHIHI